MLQQVTRPLRFLMAKVELTSYIQGAVRLCIACKLHAISSPHVLSYFPISILPKPADASEVRDRVDVFWLAFTLDRYGSMCCGLNNSVLDEVRTLYFAIACISLIRCFASRILRRSSRNPL
jgi:hypothetical protein